MQSEAILPENAYRAIVRESTIGFYIQGQVDLTIWELGSACSEKVVHAQRYIKENWVRSESHAHVYVNPEYDRFLHVFRPSREEHVGRKLRLAYQYGAPPGERPDVNIITFDTSKPHDIASLYATITEEIAGILDYRDPNDQNGFHMSIRWDDEW